MSDTEQTLQPIYAEQEMTMQLATANDLLLKAQWPHLVINEQRLILYMLSLIKPSDKDFQTYRITIKELSNILGLKRKDLYREFDRAADGLMSKVINWIEPEHKSGKKFVKVAWCSYAARIPGEGVVEMRFDPSLKPFLLALKGNFTIWGDRRSVIRLKSHYSLRLYQFIKYNQGVATVDKRTSVTVELSWLKEYLAIPEGAYNLFGNFKSKVLKPAQKDIRDKTDVEFEFEQIKKGRKVHALKFTWKKNRRHNQLEIPGLSDKAPTKIEDILHLEFGITPEKKVDELVREYGESHIRTALESARDYIDTLRQRGKKVSSVAGIARKAIEEGWQPRKAGLEIEFEQKLLAQVEAREAEIRRKEEQAAREEAIKLAAMARYESMAGAEKEAFLSDFREYLVATGNRIVVDHYDEDGINPAPVAGLFAVFVRERLGEETG